jgi:hypothetical protein
MDTEKIVRSIVRVADDRTKPVKKSFKFNLLKLLVKQDKEIYKKIVNANDNENKWDPNCIQNLALNGIQSIFFNIIDVLKTEKTGYNNQEYYIMERHLEMMLSGYLEKVSDLEEQIDKLRDSSITEEEHMEEIKEFKKIIKEKDNEIKRLEEKLISERKFAKEKEEYNESILRKQIEYEMKVKEASSN